MSDMQSDLHFPIILGSINIGILLMMKMFSTKEVSVLCWSHTEVFSMKELFPQRDLLLEPPGALYEGLIGEE